MFKGLCASVVMLAILACGDAFGQNRDKKPVKDDPMAALAPFVGEWHIDAKWASGEKLKARGVYDWGLGKKILVAKTFVMDGDKEYQRYEGTMAWHPAKKSLFQISFAYDGAITETIMETKEKDTIHFGFTPFEEGKPSLLRQTIRFTDKDHFVWTVQLKQGADWKQLMEGTWVRKGAMSR